MDGTMKLQHQIRVNAEEMSSYLADLSKWEKESAKKDSQLSNGSGINSVFVNSNNFKNNLTQSTSNATATTNSAKVKYTSELTPASLTDSLSAALPVTAQVPKASGQASLNDMETKTREFGNQEYQKGNFNEAVKLYTKCIGLKTHNYVAFSNRSMALIKLKDFVRAEKDCSSALQIEPSHIKSLTRRATARNALGKHRGALQDLLCAFDIVEHSTGADVTNELKLINSDIAKTKELLRNAVSHAPMIPVNTAWSDEDMNIAITVLNQHGGDENMESLNVKVAAEAGPEPRMA